MRIILKMLGGRMVQVSGLTQAALGVDQWQSTHFHFNILDPLQEAKDKRKVNV